MGKVGEVISKVIHREQQWADVQSMYVEQKNTAAQNVGQASGGEAKAPADKAAPAQPAGQGSSDGQAGEKGSA